MDRYARGDNAAFAELYDLLAPRLYRFLRRSSADGMLAEDLVQQTFLQMHHARERYQTGLDVLPWAFAIARRLRIDAFRKSGREVGDERLPYVVSTAPSPFEELAHQRASMHLTQTLSELPPAQREVYELVQGDGLTMAQAAAVLDTTILAVKLRLFRARQSLQAAAKELL